jgi:hypothetical protein
MGTVQVLSSDAVMDFVNNGVINASINGSGELVLEKPGGVTVNLGAVTDHSELLNLTADDHTQYALADGSRGAFATEAQGEKADASRLHVNAEVEVTGADSDGFIEQFTVADDSSSTSGWPDRLVGFFRPPAAIDAMRRMVFWLNEYLELRLAPAKHNTVALRIFIRDNSTVQSTARDADVPLLQLMDDRTNRTPVWGLYPNGRIRIEEEEIETAHVLLLDSVEAVPTGTPAGTVIVRTT